MGWREQDEHVPVFPPPLGSPHVPLPVIGMSYGDPHRAEHNLGGSCLVLPKRRGSTGQCRAAAGKIVSEGLSRAAR